MPDSSSVCPRCHSAIPTDAPGGICPACALRGAVEGSEPAPLGAAGTPTVEEMAAAFPEYEVLGTIGRGGMSVVFQARQPRLDRMVALKILPPSLAAQAGFAERFTREARALARLAHPHIVAVYDFGERAGFYFLAMEFVDGVNLREALRAGITPAQALQLVPRICEALQFAHDRGVLHRDIKPENILLDRAGSPKLADFGIAKLADEGGASTSLTATGAALGTAAYMAPEQIEKPATVDHRADIYSLGVVLYEMLTGELPLGRFAAPSEKSEVSHGIDEVVFRALEKERSRRQQSATQMKTEVEGARAGMHQAPLTAAPEPEETETENRWPLIFTALTVLSSLGIAISAMLRWKTPSVLHMVAFTMVFGVLIGISGWFTGEKKPAPATSFAPVREKDTGIAYLLWFLGGLFGVHRFYLGQVGWGLLYFFTAGLFFIGWFIDLFTLPAQVRRANEALRRSYPPGAAPLVPAGPSSPWPARVALLAVMIIGGLMIAGALAMPWKNASWSYHADGGSWSGHFSVNDKKPGATATPKSSPTPAETKLEPASSTPTPTPTPTPKPQ